MDFVITHDGRCVNHILNGVCIWEDVISVIAKYFNNQKSSYSPLNEWLQHENENNIPFTFTIISFNYYNLLPNISSHSLSLRWSQWHYTGHSRLTIYVTFLIFSIFFCGLHFVRIHFTWSFQNLL